MNRDHLIQLSQGIYANPQDPNFRFKLWKYRHEAPDSPLEQAYVLVKAGQYKKAKQLYLSMIRYQDRYFLHTRLAPLVTLAEAEALKHKYVQTPAVYNIYEARAAFLTGREPKYIHKTPDWKAFYKWFTLFTILCLLTFGIFYCLHNRLWNQNRKYNTSIEYTNTLKYIDQLPAYSYQGQISLPNTKPDSITQIVDNQNLPSGVPYELEHTGRPIGYVMNQGGGQYVIGLLKPSTSSASSLSSGSTPTSLPTSGTVPTALPQSYLINATRTAYAYYLQTHRDQPPMSLRDIKGLLPPNTPLGRFQYLPVTNVTTAIQPDSGTNPPYVSPLVLANITRHTLSLTYQGKPLLTTSIGVGSPQDPTPTGTYTITNHVPNHGPPVYGKYIFPLNNSNYALHGTNSPTHIGKSESLGCLEMPNSADEKMYELVPIGTPVQIASRNQSGTRTPNWFRD